jgi:hypothetical protein
VYKRKGKKAESICIATLSYLTYYGVTVAYRLEGMRMLLDKLACGAAGNRWQLAI